MRSLNYTIMNATNAASTANSSIVDCYNLVSISAIASYSSDTLAGSLKFQASNDISTANNLAVDQTPSVWVDIPNASATVVAGASVIIPKIDLCYRWVRLVWTPSAGTGTLTVNIDSLGF